jgi:hypothetical protein
MRREYWIGGMMMLLFGGVVATLPAQAALITFDDAIGGVTSYGFDGDGDLIDDVIFSTSDPFGFNTTGPGPDQLFIEEPGLEGTAELDPDLRVDFLHGAVDFIAFGFATAGFSSSSGSFELFDSLDNSLGSARILEEVFDIGGDRFSGFPEGEINLSFGGVAAYGLFDFSQEHGRYIIDNFEGTYGSTEPTNPVPEPVTVVLFGIGVAGLMLQRRFRA